MAQTMLLVDIKCDVFGSTDEKLGNFIGEDKSERCDKKGRDVAADEAEVRSDSRPGFSSWHFS